MNSVIDLRSDTVTRPTAAMREAMATAEVGDDVWGDDPTVHALEEKTAALLGKEAAVFVPTGTQSNLCGLMAHCARGDEYIVGQNAHTYRYEAGGAAVLGSIQPQPIEMAADGTLPLDDVAAKIKPADPHFANTRLLAIENTHDGKALPLDYLASLRDFADTHHLGLHLDGARLWNAAVASKTSEAELAAPFDTISVCLSKGLGAPIGSVLVGSVALVDGARRWRKMLGGAMRQSGIAAAAGIHALDHHRAGLARDHQMAAELGDALATVDGIEVTGQSTNMVFVDFSGRPDAAGRFDDAGFLTPDCSGRARFVTHRDLPDNTTERVVQALQP